MLSFNLAEWVSIISTGATLLMVVATWKMANVTRLTLEELNKPHVIVYPQMREGEPSIINIVIENIGTAAAYNVKFNISDNLYAKAFGIAEADREPLKFTHGALVEGIQYLPPSDKRIFIWGQFGGITRSLQGKSACIVALFTDSTKNKRYSTENLLDIKDFSGVDAHTPIEVEQLRALQLLPVKFDKLISLFDKKLCSQSSEAAYTWAYIVWKLLEPRGFQRECIYKYGRGAGLTDEQMLNAENAAYSLLQEYCPDQFPKADQS